MTSTYILVGCFILWLLVIWFAHIESRETSVFNFPLYLLLCFPLNDGYWCGYDKNGANYTVCIVFRVKSFGEGIWMPLMYSTRILKYSMLTWIWCGWFSTWKFTENQKHIKTPIWILSDYEMKHNILAVMCHTLLGDGFFEEVLLYTGQIMKKVFIPIDGSHIEFQEIVWSMRFLLATYIQMAILIATVCNGICLHITILPIIQIVQCVCLLFATFLLWFQ